MRPLPARIAAAFLLVFGFLPLVNWIPGGHKAPWYAGVATLWLSGGTIALGVGVVLAILSRRLSWLWHEGLLSRPTAWFARQPLVATATVAVLALGLYLVIARAVLGARPLLIDEGIQLLQARIFLAGRLWMPVAPNPEFFSSMHLIDSGGRVYGQFPAGGPAMLLPGVAVGAPWIVGPVFGALSVLAFGLFVRVAEPRPSAALGAVLLFAFAPFVAFMSGSHMNHVTSLTWILVALAALARVTTSETPQPAGALLAGLGFGLAATIRPVDAFAFALPAGAWLLWRTLRERRRWPELVASGLGVALPMLLLMWVNFNTTGAPLRFGYQVLWGKIHDLGFHAAPWGKAHTPLGGIELVSLYFLRLQTYLYETALPSLLPALVALGLTRRLGPLDRYLLVSAALVIGLYFAYWHDGFFLGPRFMFPLAPVLALWTARALTEIGERWGHGVAYRSAAFVGLASGVMGVTLLLPIRVDQYRKGLASMRWDQRRAAEAAGVRNALVFVRESWGAQLIARMWALDISRTNTELIYRFIDACALETTLDSVEAAGLRGDRAFQVLHPLLRDSSHVMSSPFSTDTTEKVLPNSRYTAECVRRLQEDRAGFTVLTPMELSDGGENIYARDLHARDSLLIRQYPGRPVFLLKPPDTRIGTDPQFLPVSLDSARAAWAQDARR